MNWADDPELVAGFRQEVEERLRSLSDGLLALEGHGSPRQAVAALFRDAHTVKGSARMLGLDAVVGVAHRAEDLLGAIRDGRLTVRRDLVDVLLAATEGIGRALPGVPRPVAEGDLAALVAALDSALAGEDPVAVPRLGPAPADLEGEPDSGAAGHGPAGRRGESVRVPTRRVHALLDVVGEAELDARRMEGRIGDLSSWGAEHREVVDWLRRAVLNGVVWADLADAVHSLAALDDRLNAATRELRSASEDAGARLARVREGAMGLAMVPVRRVAAAFPQLVREIAGATGKDVAFVVDGDDVELDARVLDGVADALRHLVANAVDHGCESPEARRAAGKPPQAVVRLSARASGAVVVIEVSDDGEGIDESAVRAAAVTRGLLAEDSSLSGQPLLQLLFAAGFTTRDEVTATSGRGVGLDVVRAAVEDLGGSVAVHTAPGEGTAFVMTLPVTLGVMRCLVARVGDERYALPTAHVVETFDLASVTAHSVAGATVVMRHGRQIPLADLGQAVAAPGERAPRAAVVVRYGSADEQLAWAVDALESELELVVKDLGGFLGRLRHITGATLDGEGGVVLLLDVRELALSALGRGAARLPDVAGVAAGAEPRAAAAPSGARPRVLVVEDSIGVRELQRVILEGAGYEVQTAVDGADGASRLAGAPVDLVLSDVEMPGMDGFTLTRTIRRTRGWEDVPVVIMTSRGGDADKRAGLDAGASAYLLKSDFDQAELINTVRRLVGR
jgi:chemotaxis protein histidine kinase CheA